MSSEPLWLDVGGRPCLGLLDEPLPAVPGAPAVILPPPFGWEELCSYRSRHVWAHDLAARGFRVLRLDLPGTGDSAGSAADPQLLDAWTDAVVAGVELLRERGASRVAAVGLGLGGLLSVAAVARGAEIDDLVLWGVPARGRTLARELRAFAALEQAEVAAFDGTVPETHHDGRIVVAGFLLTPATLAALEALDPTAGGLPPRPGTRTLLLDRDGVGPDARLVAALEAAGGEVATEPGPGWGQMIEMPHLAVAPSDVIARAGEWLAGAPPAPRSPAAPAAPRAGEGATVAPGVQERVLQLPSTLGEVVAIGSEPESDSGEPLTLVLLNAGAIRRIGPGRMWVEAARRWAQRGVPAVRADLAGIGDAEGERDPLAPELGLYVPSYVAQVREVLDGLQRLGYPGRFVLAGLCSGAYWSLHAAVEDERVVAAVLLNPRAITSDVLRQQMSGEVSKLVSATAWGKVLRGGVSPAAMTRRLGRLLQGVIAEAREAPVRARRRVGAEGDELEGLLGALEESGHHATMLFSVDEPLPEALRMSGRWDRVTRSPAVTVERIEGHDHTLRPLVMQAAAHAVIDGAVEAELVRARSEVPATA
ncbi:MAG: hypothetical protein ACJ762_13315 [Solirubrobacteraceae bacterium]